MHHCKKHVWNTTHLRKQQVHRKLLCFYSHLGFVAFSFWFFRLSSWSLLLSLSKRCGRGLGMFSSLPRKTLRKHYTRPQNTWSSQKVRRQRWTPPGSPYLLTGLHGRCAGLLVLLFWFLSRPGTVAITDSHILAHFGPFSFFLQWVSSCFFPDTVQSMDEIAVLLSQSFLDLFKARRLLFKSKQGDFIKSLCVCAQGVDCTDASGIPQTIQSLACQYKTGIEEACVGWKRNVSCYNHSCHSDGNG